MTLISGSIEDTYDCVHVLADEYYRTWEEVESKIPINIRLALEGK